MSGASALAIRFSMASISLSMNSLGFHLPRCRILRVLDLIQRRLESLEILRQLAAILPLLFLFLIAQCAGIGQHDAEYRSPVREARRPPWPDHRTPAGCLGRDQLVFQQRLFARLDPVGFHARLICAEYRLRFRPLKLLAKLATDAYMGLVSNCFCLIRHNVFPLLLR